MSLIFVWSPSPGADWGSHGREADRFRTTVESLRSRHEEVLGRRFTAKTQRVGNAWIGQLDVDSGITGWSSWIEHDGKGVAWSGVCETFLGRTDPHAVTDEVCRTVFERPRDTAEWHGAFDVVAWDRSREEVAVLVSATEPLPLWETRGPHGWAVGSRARPLLDLVGRDPELDVLQASLFLSFGYLAGEGSLFRGVDRVPARKMFTVTTGEEPRGETYLSTSDIFERGATHELGFRDAVALAGDRLTARVARELQHSPNPTLSLTGGRDSRSVAAALYAAGYPGPAHTAGALDSPDVEVAGRVASALGFEHRTSGAPEDFLARMVERPDRARLWTELTEGIETVRHALHYGPFFRDPDVQTDDMRQSFTGANPGLRAIGPTKWGRDAMLSRVDPALHAPEAAREQMMHVIERVERATREAGGDPEDAPEMMYWANHALVWGQDNVGTKFGLASWWNPLMDVSLVQASWRLPRDAKPPKVFAEGLAEYLAPQLKHVPYEHVSRPDRMEKYVRRARRRLTWLLGPPKLQAFRPGPERKDHWEWFLFERPARVWPHLIGEERVRSALESNVNAQLLWSIATLELFAETHLDGSGMGDASSADVELRAGEA